MDLRQKLRKMWSPIAPLHGFAIKSEAIFPGGFLPHQHQTEKLDLQ